MSDVTAVLLSIGEPYAERALASVRAQQPAVAEVIRVEHVSPFHRALNQGAARTRTEFFIQVDADMVLDPTCVAELRAEMRDEIGMVVGFLRDPLLGRIVGIKLFRRACFDVASFPDALSPDTDFESTIAAAGWRSVRALRFGAATVELNHCFGDHLPEYGPSATFRMFRLRGARIRYRRRDGALWGLLRQLHRSRHPVAPIALIAAAHGALTELSGDLLQPSASDHDSDLVCGLIAGVEAIEEPEPLSWGSSPEEAFAAAYREGISLRSQRAGATLLARLRALGGATSQPERFALLGLCEGVVCGDEATARVEEARQRASVVVRAPRSRIVRPARWWNRAVGRLAHLRRGLTGRFA